MLFVIEETKSVFKENKCDSYSYNSYLCGLTGGIEDAVDFSELGESHTALLLLLLLFFFFIIISICSFACLIFKSSYNCEFLQEI